MTGNRIPEPKGLNPVDMPWARAVTEYINGRRGGADSQISNALANASSAQAGLFTALETQAAQIAQVQVDTGTEPDLRLGVPTAPTLISALTAVTVTWDGEYAPEDPPTDNPPDVTKLGYIVAEATLSIDPGPDPDNPVAPTFTAVGTPFRTGGTTFMGADIGAVPGDTVYVQLRPYKADGTASVDTSDVVSVVLEGVVTTDIDSAITDAIEQAQTDADAALVSANGKNKNYYQATEPDDATQGPFQNGDTWFDTDDGNRIYVWNGTIWSDAQDADILAAANAASDAASAASAAQLTANAKNRVIRSASDASSPASYIAGDQWWKYSGSQVVGFWLHDGTAWVSQTLTDAVITNLDAGSITAGTLSADRIGANSLTIGKVSGLQDGLDSAVPRVSTGAATKLYRDVFNFSAVTPAAAGSIVFVTKIPFTGPMIRMKFEGRTLSAGDISGELSMYCYATGGGTIYQPRYTSVGSLSVKVEFAKDVNNNLVLIFTRTDGAAWPYPSLSITEMQATYQYPDGMEKGWLGTVTTDLSPYAATKVAAYSSRDINENYDLTQGWRSTGTTTIDGGKITADTVTAGSIKAWTIAAGQAIIADSTITNAKIANLDAGKITTGFLDVANRIKAKSIAASQLLITDIQNYFNDPTFASASGYAPWTVVGEGLEKNGTGASHGAYAASTQFAVTPGDKFVVSATRTDIAGSTGTASILLQRRNGAGTWAYWVVSLSMSAAGASTSAPITVPADTTAVMVGFYTSADMPTTTKVRITDVRIQKMMAGELIVDGAITTRTLAAGAVTATELATNAVTAGKINAGAIDGMVITGPTIRTAASGQRVQLDTGGLKSYNSANAVTGQLSASSGGLTLSGTLRSGSGNQRAELYSNGLRFYESGGALSGDITGYSPVPGSSANSLIYIYAGTGSYGIIVGKQEASGGGTQVDLTASGAEFNYLGVTELVAYGITANFLEATDSVTAPNLPFATATGRLAGVSVIAGGLTNTAVTFPGGRFTVAPIVNVTQVGSDYRDIMVGATSVTATGMTVWRGSAYNPGIARSGVLAEWTATQMTSTTATG